ncbi:MAG: hypothetical protein LAT55_12075 [Opitutales bacterium]|nr:hypothetical protein [Opitutales bacterium]
MNDASLIQEIAHQHLFNQFWLSLFFIIPMILVARAVVAGTRYSAILIIVIFGLVMGYLLVATGLSEPGLGDLPMLGLIAQSTIVALAASFFVGGQELRRIFSDVKVPPDQTVSYAMEQIFFGTGRTQVIFIARAFFLLLGIAAMARLLSGTVPDTALGRYYPLIAYMGLIIAVILIDHKATIANKRDYLRKGLLEIVGVIVVLLIGYFVATLVGPVIALPQIFFVMLAASGLGAILFRWYHGPTIRCLLFAGIPVVLAANFIIGGSRIGGAFDLPGMNAVLAYGFFGQIFWMFGGIALLMLAGRTGLVRNVGPGMAGALSHAGLTGACTAGDLGDGAARRAPIMINIPFFGHIFVFSVLAMSASRGELLMVPSLIIAFVGIALTAWSLRGMASAEGEDSREVKALMQFSFGWQLTAVFGGLVLLALSQMPVGYAMMATSSSLSHFGLFAAIQEGMAGPEAAGLIAFVFAMPFLVHPLVFFLFGKAMESDGLMPAKAVYTLALIGFFGVLSALFFF